MTFWRGVGVGRVLGVPVRLDLSWFVGLGILVVLSRELWAPAATGVAAALWSGLFAVAFFGCVLAHELAHAVVARAVGVPTTEIRLFVFGGVARIAAEPDAPGDEALVAMAGPLASVTLSGLLALASWTAAGPPGDLLALLSAGNLVVAAFNLLPGFPLDGGRVARALVWRLTGRRLLATRITALGGRALGAAWSWAGPGPPSGSGPRAGCPRWSSACSCGRPPPRANAPPRARSCSPGGPSAGSLLSCS